MFCPLEHFSSFSILIEKLQAMKRCKNKKKLLPRLIQLLLSTISLGLFLSSPLWLPTTISILREIAAIVFGHKGLFIVCNIIVVVLVGESKLSKFSLQPDIYQEYVERSRSIQNGSIGNEEEVKVEKRCEEEEVVDEEVYETVEEMGEKGLDELNQRVESFIARVNKQRKLEARLSGLS